MTVQPGPAWASHLEDRNRTARITRLARQAQAQAKEDAAQAAKQAAKPVISPASFQARSSNELRPRTFAEVVGQEPAKLLLSAAIESANLHHDPLAHILLTGPGGTGKSTLAHVAGDTMGVHVYQVSAPVAYDVLLALREQMHDRDILFVDEIHLMAIAERRGKESISQPEQFYSILEDGVILTPTGPLPFPAITVIGATTDPGRLPLSFLDRFPVQPRMNDYTDMDMAVIAYRNVKALGMGATDKGVALMATASAGVPRKVNNLVRQAKFFSTRLDVATVQQVLAATGIAPDGLDGQQQGMLWFLRYRGETDTRAGVVYQSSLGSIATFLGLSRDTKAVALYVEPLLIKRGYIQTTTQGRRLTKRGIKRAIQVRR